MDPNGCLIVEKTYLKMDDDAILLWKKPIKTY